MQTIKKGIILCGGYGTRFLPITKVLPKELFPIINKPAISYIIDELVQSGITEILIVINKRKNIIKKYFQKDTDYESFVKNKQKYLDLLDTKPKNIKLKFAYQAQQLGSANALLVAKDFVGKDDFCLLYGDDLIMSKTPVTKQLINSYQKHNTSVLGVMACDPLQINKYGVIDGTQLNKKEYICTKIIEKPEIGTIRSNLVSTGRYVFQNKILDHLTNLQQKNGEYQLTDAINNLSNFVAYKYIGKRFDLGDKKGLLQANNYVAKNIYKL